MPPASDGLRWVYEASFTKLVGVARSTYFSWEAEELLLRPPTGAYTETHLVEAIVLSAIRGELSLPATRNTIARLREDGVIAAITDRWREPEPGARLDLVIDLEISDVSLCEDDASFLAAARDAQHARRIAVLPLADRLTRALRGFGIEAQTGATPKKRSRGRPARTPASVTPLRGGG